VGLFVLTPSFNSTKLFISPQTKGTTVKLTKEQAKMVIEYFSRQAAEDAPVEDKGWTRWDRHMWMTCFQTSLAIERKIDESFWAQLINAQLDAQTFDRDPDGYLHERGYDGTEGQRLYMEDVLKDLVSSSIDQTYQMSQVA
jgi:hypothetical protein